MSSCLSASTDELELPKDFGDYKVACLPVIANFLQKLGVIALVDRCVPSPENISSGQVVVGMVMDTLAGRSPLYKLADFFVGQDTELLFGSPLEASDFNDNNVGKVLDNIHSYGASKLFSQISWQACKRYDLDDKYLHYDTTSVSVHGDYAAYAEETDEHIAIVHGFSKDKRPDMKQFMIEALCVKGNVPLLGAVLSGNTSDKKANNVELTLVASHMKKHGLDPKAYIYIADSAVVTEENLDALLGQPFVSRLPANYQAEQAAIAAAFEANDWTEVGALAERIDPSQNRPSARYKIHETTVELYGRPYRAIVTHSSAHDKRRTKKLDQQIAAEKETFAKLEKQALRQTFACAADARRHAETLAKKNRFQHHRLETTIQEEPIHAPGRPKAGQPRKVVSRRHRIQPQLIEQTEAIAKIRQRTGCFVLISNVAVEGQHAQSPLELLKAYKEQNGIEMNFRFLKDPVIVNNTFLKKAERIEALGFILLLSLMVWNLIQHLLRQHLKEHHKTIRGWDNKPTQSPTTSMVLFHFQHISIFRWDGGRQRRLSRSLLEHQRDYLQALGLPETIFTIPVQTIPARKKTNKLVKNAAEASGM